MEVSAADHPAVAERAGDGRRGKLLITNYWFCEICATYLYSMQKSRLTVDGSTCLFGLKVGRGLWPSRLRLVVAKMIS